MSIIPSATYRLQFNSSFGFKHASEIAPYLANLGLSTIYASPIFKSRAGSTHGYDIVDPDQLSPELGSQEEFQRMISTVRWHRLSWLQDIVPNHMAIDSDNLMLMDVLEIGEQSEFFGFFEIYWDHPYENMRGRLLVPLLGRFYAECLADGEITLAFDQRGLSINYYQLRLPLRIESYARVFEHNIESLEGTLGSEDPSFVNFLGTINFLKSLAQRKTGAVMKEPIRHAKRGLWRLYSANEEIRQFVDSNIAYFNGTKGEPRSFDELDSLISEQLFRLSFWKVATEEINYRRFFTVNDLISVNVNEEPVFEYTHRLIRELAKDAVFAGFRVDHIDGLYDPAQYLERLAKVVGDKYIVVEKILEPSEHLPQSWPVHGTTGYDFLNEVTGLLCDRSNRDAFSKVYYKFTRLQEPYQVLLHQKKQLILGKHMAGNIDNLAQYLKSISGDRRYGRDITLYGLRRALVEIMAQFPVYRTYIHDTTCTESDCEYIITALRKARRQSPDLLYELNFLEQYLLLEFDESLPEERRRQWMDFVMSFQQYTGPLMAKGVEDTMMYVYNRLIAFNEVGSGLHEFGVSVDEAHRFFAERKEHHPHTLNATSTHDTKRGEDVRMRLAVLSELPREWEYNLKNWARLNRTRKKRIEREFVPDKNDEYFLYQTLLGTCPPSGPDERYIERIKQYGTKAIREAKVHTAWIKPDTEYESAYTLFVDKILTASDKNRFLSEFFPFLATVTWYGILNSLSQVIIKMTAPGVPDFYQGTELWDLNLVDPDNRRPVDFADRRAALAYIMEKEGSDPRGLIAELLDTMEDGRVKLFLIYKALRIRREKQQLFDKGEYVPLEVEGKFADHVFAFLRKTESQWAITAAPRLLTDVVSEGRLPLGREVWEDTRILLPGGLPKEWGNGFSGLAIPARDDILLAGDLFEYFPVSLALHG
jgi:(1->4)-alpha-D-glucan 1-alpha-D-glucosylmutase